MVFTCEFVKSPAEFLIPSDGHLLFSVSVGLLNALKICFVILHIRLFSTTGELDGILAELRFCRGITKCGIDKVSNLSLLNLRVPSVGILHVPHLQQETYPYCPVLQAMTTLYSGRNFAHLEIFHVAHIVNPSLDTSLKGL